MAAFRRPDVVEPVLIAFGFVLLFAALPHALFGDDHARFDDIEQLLHHGELSDSRYSLVMPLVASPFLLLGELVGSPSGWAARVNVIILAAGASLIWLLLRDRVDRSLLRRSLLVVLFASFVTSKLRDFNAEILTATLATVGIAALVWSRHRRLGWAAIVVGVVNTPAALVGLGMVSLFEAVRLRRILCLVPVAAAMALIMLEAWIRRGGPLTTGYSGDHGFRTVLPYSGKPGFSYPFIFGVASILFSFGRGLVFFMPGLVLWLRGDIREVEPRLKRAVALMLLFLGGLVLVYSKWWAWYGGLAWGPRFFVFAAVPASVLLALAIGRAGTSPIVDGFALGVLVLSSWVAVAGVVASRSSLDFCARDAFSRESLCWYSPEFSPLGQPLVHFPAISSPTALVAAYCVLVATYLAAPLIRALAGAAKIRLEGRRFASR